MKTEDHSGALAVQAATGGLESFFETHQCCKFPLQGRHPMLLYEAKLLKHLEGGTGIAHVHYSGSEGLEMLVMSVPESGLGNCSRCVQRHGDGSPRSIFGGKGTNGNSEFGINPFLLSLLSLDFKMILLRISSAVANASFPSRLSCSLRTR